MKVFASNLKGHSLEYLFILLMVFYTIYPTYAMSVRNGKTTIPSYYMPLASGSVKSSNTMALPGGPDQPESKGFTPIGVSDMVDPFSGDFTYNIPLLDIDGYPINLAYNGNVGMNSESSWVGLGWSLNPGAVNRSMRGIPDDFNGEDEIKTVSNAKTDLAFSLGANFSTEIFGFETKISDAFDIQTLLGTITVPGVTEDNGGVNLNFGANITYSNYNGFSTGISFGPSFSLAKDGKMGVNGSLGISGNSQAGPSVSPSAGLTLNKTVGKNENTGFSTGLNIGSSYSSRRGFDQVSFNTSISTYERLESTSYNKKANTFVQSHSRKGGSVNAVSTSFPMMQSTYVPSYNSDRVNNSITFSVKVGLDALGTDGTGDFSGSARWAKMKTNEASKPAYGYLYHGDGQNDDDAMLDFNRDNDGSFSESTPTIGIPTITQDAFNVSAQGISGSYMPVHKGIPYVYDPQFTNSNNSFGAGFEIGIGGTAKVGGDVNVASTQSKSKSWKDDNPLIGRYGVDNSSKPIFRNAGEMSILDNTQEFENFGGSDPIALKVTEAKSVQDLAFNKQRKVATVPTNQSDPTDPDLDDAYKREAIDPIPSNKDNFKKSNQLFRYLTHGELLEEQDLVPLTNEQKTDAHRKKHHIGAVFVTNAEGKRFNYGIAAYNLSQDSYTFAVGASKTNAEKAPGTNGQLQNKYVGYNHDMMGIDNKHGIDHFFNKKSVPAYPHSYLLTSILSDDYIDNDGVVGPSINDYGTYYKFDYKKTGVHKWRNPVEKDVASFNVGLYSQNNDDKANVSFGTKELWYLNTIESKNQIAVFHTSVKKDGYGVMNEHGGVDPSGAGAQHKLDSIQLYNLSDYNTNGSNAIPIKTVVFEYTYDLCPGYPNNINTHNSVNSDNGKLTLKEVYFKYETSERGRFNSYQFGYSNNASFSPMAVDAWGNYKPVPTTGLSNNINESAVHPNDFPYVDQDKSNTDDYSSKWMLDQITLPSGGKINVTYESDDYAFVQYQRAMQMFNVVAAYDGSNFISPNAEGELNIEGNKHIVVDLGDANDPLLKDDPEYYLKGITDLYFRCLVKYPAANVGGKDRYDYVPGFGQINWDANPRVVTRQGRKHLIVPMFGMTLRDNGGSTVNPITYAGIHFGRNYLSTYLPPSGQELDQNGGLSAFLDFCKSVAGAFTSLGELVTGPNQALYNQDVAKKIVTPQSYVRLYSSKASKLGGGCRVQKIEMTDGWNAMTGGGEKTYGQEYFYVTETGITSGVAQFEPEPGSDQSPFVYPLFQETEYKAAPDDKSYQLGPVGRAYFPAASVGYSRVVIQSLTNPNVNKNSTGFTVKEFYTAKDFPTFSDFTIIKEDYETFKQKKSNFSVLLYSQSRDFAKVSQGVVIENNDMHGKEKATYVYAEENPDDPISSVKYDYLCEDYKFLSVPEQKTPEGLSTRLKVKKLVNDVVSIKTDGSESKSVIGLKYDLVMDLRESTSQMHSGGLNVNLNVILFAAVPMILGNYANEKTEFRSCAIAKSINRFGILSKTTATDYGSKVQTENLAYDAETGAVLLTRVNTNFNDELYSMNIPAHWYYERMGHAYKSGLFEKDYSSSPKTISNGGVTGIGSKDNLVVGDEVMVINSNSATHAWIKKSLSNSILLMDQNGNPINKTGVTKLRVIRSGRRNMQGSNIATIVSRQNPLKSLTSNDYDRVLQASAIEFSDVWRLDCGCLADSPTLDNSTNIFYRGERGRFKPKASYSYLTNRAQTFENENSNIREDGFFVSFNPFYKNIGGDWKVDKQNWTFASDIRDINSLGQAIETKDALNRYTSTLYSFNKTLPTGIAVNTRYNQIGEESFEDLYPGTCESTEFTFNQFNNNFSTDKAHSGRSSIKVSSGNEVKLSREIKSPCDVVQCKLTLSVEPNDQSSVTNGYTVKVEKPNGAFNYELELVFGEIDEEDFDDATNQYLIGSNNAFEANIIVTDAEGCSVKKNIKAIQ